MADQLYLEKNFFLLKNLKMLHQSCQSAALAPPVHEKPAYAVSSGGGSESLDTFRQNSVSEGIVNITLLDNQNFELQSPRTREGITERSQPHN